MYNRNSWPWKITAYSEQAYWFDWEGNDITTDYVNLLKGVEAISHGEIEFTMRVMSDWLDELMPDIEKGLQNR